MNIRFGPKRHFPKNLTIGENWRQLILVHQCYQYAWHHPHRWNQTWTYNLINLGRYLKHQLNQNFCR